jgi:hypothetical protein
LSKKDNLVEVYKARTEMEARVIKGLLDSFGIPCFLKANAAPSILTFTTDGLAQVKIMCLPEQAEEAKELINNNEAKATDSPEDSE